MGQNFRQNFSDTNHFSESFEQQFSLKNFLRILGVGNLAECQRGPKVAHYYTAPPCPRRFLQRLARNARIWQSTNGGPFRGAAFPPLPKGAASVVVYLANGTVWTQGNFVEIFEKNHQVGYRCLAESPVPSPQSSCFWKFWNFFSQRILPKKGRHFWTPS